MNRKKSKAYKALSLVELIISVGVAGITLLVLMTIAANNMKEAVRYERHDALTRLSMDAALVVRRHAEAVNDKRQEGIYFGSEDDILPQCYRVERGEDLWVDFETSYSQNRLPEEEDLHVDVIYDSKDIANELGDKLYVAYCVQDEISTATNTVYVGDIISGYVDCGNCEIEEYSYSIIVSIINEI